MLILFEQKWHIFYPDDTFWLYLTAPKFHYLLMPNTSLTNTLRQMLHEFKIYIILYIIINSYIIGN